MINELFSKYKTILTVVLLSVMATIITILLLMLYAKNVKIENLEASIKKCSLEKQNETNNNLTLHQVIRDLNNQNVKDSIDYEKRLKKFKDEKDEILGINYKNLRSDDCEDIKLILDDIRINGY